MIYWFNYKSTKNEYKPGIAVEEAYNKTFFPS